jgi:hypothetical protein
MGNRAIIQTNKILTAYTVRKFKTYILQFGNFKLIKIKKKKKKCKRALFYIEFKYNV